MEIQELKDKVIAKADEMLEKEDLTTADLSIIATVVKTLDHTFENTMTEMFKAIKPKGEKDEKI
jgi:hypothetical protein